MIKYFDSKFIGIILLVLLCLFSVLVPFFSGYEPHEQDLMKSFSGIIGN